MDEKIEVKIEIIVTDYLEIETAVEVAEKMQKEHSCNCTLFVKKLISVV